MIWFIVMSLGFASTPIYAEALKRFVSKEGVDYPGMKASIQTSQLLKEFSEAKIPEGTKASKAFYINAYNAISLSLVIDNYPLKSIKELDDGKVWSRRKHLIAGKLLSLDEVENKILRKMDDPRIHAALNCGSKSCPPLSNKPYTKDQIDTELDMASRAWIKSTAFRLDGNYLHLNEIFRWFQEDFNSETERKLPTIRPEERGVVLFISKYTDSKIREKLLSAKLNLKYESFNWELNSSTNPTD